MRQLIKVLGFIALWSYYCDTAVAFTVADDECPNPVSENVDNPHCHRTYHCDRTDDTNWTVTDNGYPDTAQGDTLNCDSCSHCGNEYAPPNSKCETTLQACFTESCSVNKAVGVSGDTWFSPLKGKLEIAFNDQDGHQVCHSVTCGTVTWPKCVKGYPAYDCTMTVTKGLKAEFIHHYHWAETVNPDPGYENQCSANSPGENAGTRKTTGAGTRSGSSATCRTRRADAC